jgi:hypothetical protein
LDLFFSLFAQCEENYGLFVRESQIQHVESGLQLPSKLARASMSTPSKLATPGVKSKYVF